MIDAPEPVWAGVLIRMADGTTFAWQMAGEIEAEITTTHDYGDDDPWRICKPRARLSTHMKFTIQGSAAEWMTGTQYVPQEPAGEIDECRAIGTIQKAIESS